jgi:hypothetical protein
MSNFQLDQELYIHPTPSGAYYCVSGPEDSPSRQLLFSLFKERTTPKFSLESAKKWLQESDDEKALDLLYHMQKVGWIEGLKEPKEAPDGVLEEMLPQFLSSLSDKAILADEQGFYIASHGFPHETAEALSALSAELAMLYERRKGVLKNNLGLNTSAWGLVDVAGNSHIGFWPMHIGEQCFVMIIGGAPRLNQPQLTTMVWALTTRYGNTNTGDGA